MHWRNGWFLIMAYEETFRPPDIGLLVGALRRAILLFSIFFRPLYRRSSLDGTQPKPATCWEVRFENACPWSIPSPYKSGAENTTSFRTSQLNGNLNGLYLRNETLYRQSGKWVGNYRRLLHRLNTTWTLVHKRL